MRDILNRTAKNTEKFGISMSERTQRLRVVKALKPLHAIPVENPVHPGTPDVNFIHGWIELKWLRRWPKNENTIVLLPHFNVSQRNWLKKRGAYCGGCWLLLQCQREWLLFDGPTAAKHVGRVTRKGLFEVAERTWVHGLDERQLNLWLIQRS